MTPLDSGTGSVSAPNQSGSGLRAATAAPTLTRRSAIARVAALLGGTALAGGHALLTACVDTPARAAAGRGTSELTAADVALLDEIAETILPETGTPGAKAAQTGAFMALMVNEAYDPRERRVFREGLRQIDRACRRMHGVPFMSASPAQRIAVLEPIDREQKAMMDEREAARRARALAAASASTAATTTAETTPRAASPAPEPPAHYFRMMKELALLGYFTSEIGYNEAMRYVESPGRFDPCVPHAEGETAWAAHA